MATESSPLLMEVFRREDTCRRLHILDVGPAAAETFSFLGNMDCACRLHVADLIASQLIQDQYVLQEDALVRAFQRTLDRVHEPLDVALLWDLPNYLTASALSAFGRALAPHLNPGAWVHGFCVVKSLSPTMRHRYGILQAGRVVRVDTPSAPPAKHPQLRSTLVRAMPFLDMVRGALRSEGRMEVLLRRNQASARASRDELSIEQAVDRDMAVMASTALPQRAKRELDPAYIEAQAR